MSAAAELIHTLAEQGVNLRVDGDHLVIRAPAGTVAPETMARLKEHKAEVMAELAAPPDVEARRERLCKMMDEDDAERIYYWITDADSDPCCVILAIGIRGVGTCEMRIPKEKYDPFLLMEILDKHQAGGVDS